MDTKRDDYLRGIAASAPEREVNANHATNAIFSAAFDQVKDQADWKNPINALVTIHEFDPIGLDVYCKAIEYFTGTKPNTYVAQGFDEGTRKATYRIVSEGYRLGPAGDH